MGMKPRAVRLIDEVLREPDLQTRVRKTADFLDLRWHPRDVGPKYEDLIEKCLSDSLQTGDYDRALQCLEKLQQSYNARLEKRLLDLAVSVFVRANRKKDALDWIEGVAHIFGAKAVTHISEKPELKAIHGSKRFQRIVGPDAELLGFRAALRESIRMWKKDEYDNFKDALSDSQSLLQDALRLDKALVAKARAHRDEINKEARQLMEDDPVSRDYLKGLV